MRGHKIKLISLVSILSVLAFAFVLGGNYSNGDENNNKENFIKGEIEEIFDDTPMEEDALEENEEDVISTGDKEQEKVEATKKTDTRKDKYQTSPQPKGKPAPIEPQDASHESKAYTCTLSVTCHTVLKNLTLVNPEKTELIPQNGIIFPSTKVNFYEGENVFNVLQREMKKNKIHMEFRNTPVYNSAYIMGINNLYEFDVGELSGWMYKVNNWFPNYGVSRYQLKDGDIVEFVYTCNLGRDIGGSNVLGGD